MMFFISLAWSALAGISPAHFQVGEPKVIPVETPGIWGPSAFSRDGKQMACMKRNGEIIILDSKTEKIVLTLTGLDDPRQRQEQGEYSVDFNHDSSLIAATAGGRDFGLWELPSGKLIRKQIADSLHVDAVKFSPDGQCLVGIGYDGVYRAWSSKTLKEGPETLDEKDARILPKKRGGSQGVACWSPDGKYLGFRPCTQSFDLLDFETGEVVKRYKTESKNSPGLPVGASFSPDGKLFAVGAYEVTLGGTVTDKGHPGLVTIWNLETMAVTHSLQLTSRVDWVSFSSDGKTLAASSAERGFIDVWDLKSSKATRTLKGGYKYGTYSPSGDLFVALSSNGLCRWRLTMTK